MRPLKIKTKVLTDEYLTENLLNLNIDQEIKVNFCFYFNKIKYVKLNINN